jgi:cellulose biosynthesis protein BcsQ
MVPIVSFFNNKGGVGKTSLVYHLAWMYAELGVRVVAADLDPQANLTAAFLDESALASLWPVGPHPRTIAGAVDPLRRGIGDVTPAPITAVDDRIGLLPGDLSLSLFEDQLSENWPKCADGDERAFRVLSALWRCVVAAADEVNADLVLMDVGPNLGAINRSALIASDHVVVPLSPDLFSLQGLRNLGPTLHRWRDEWGYRLTRNPEPLLALPAGQMRPLGYVVLQHSVRLDRPVQAYQQWIRRIPRVYRDVVLDELDGEAPTVDDDPYCLALVKHYHSLVPLAQEARKPLFLLKPADGAIGAHQKAVRESYDHFSGVARTILDRLGLPVP